MASDVTGTVLRGFGVPLALTPDHLWAAKASYTQQGPTVGYPTAQGSYTLQLQTGGTQSADKELRVKLQRAGHPGPDGAGVIYQYEGDASTLWRGRDIQTPSGWSVIRTAQGAATSALSSPDAVPFYAADGTDKIAVIYSRTAAGPTAHVVECATYDPGTDAWTTATVATRTTAASPDGYHPCVAYNRDDGFLYVAHWVYDNTALLANVAILRSSDGATWTEVSPYAADTGVDISSSVGNNNAGYECGRLRMAFSGGQCLLVGHLVANDNLLNTRDRVVQFASTSRAGRFTQVEIALVTTIGAAEISFSHHSVMEINGVLTLLWPGLNHGLTTAVFINRVTLPSAYTSISGRSTVFIDTSSYFSFSPRVMEYSTGIVTDGDGSFWVSEDGTIYGAARITTGGTNGATMMVQSIDGTSSFQYVGNGDATGNVGDDAFVNFSGDSATHISDFVGVSHRGRQVLIHITDSDVTTTPTLGALWLGGGSTVTLPSMVTYPRTFQRSSIDGSYIPSELPANVGSLTGSGGAATASISSAGLLNITSSSNELSYYFAPTSTIAQGVIARCTYTVNSGGDLAADAVVFTVRVADNLEDFEINIRFTTAGFRMWDPNASAVVGTDKTTVAPSGGIEVLVAIVAGVFSCWFRAMDTASDRTWTAAIQGSSLTDGGGGTTGNRVLFGLGATSTANLDITEVHYMVGAHTNGALGAGFTNPDDLFGRDLPRRGRFIGIDDGVRVTAIDGSGKKGDNYNIDTAYEHPIRRIIHSESPSPRVKWRGLKVGSGNSAEEFIPFVINKDASTLGNEEQGLGQTLAYVTCIGVNWKAATVERWDDGTSAWVVVATMDNSISLGTGYVRRGSELQPPGTSGSDTGRYFYENECEGWTVVQGGDYSRITGNTAGTLAIANNGPKPTFFLRDVTGAEATSGAIVLIPNDVSMTFHTDGETGGGWGLRISAQETATLDLRMGHFSMGRVFVFGTEYSRGRVTSYESGDRTDETPSGTRRAIRAGPGGRTVRLAWTDAIDTSQTQGTAANPDYIESTSTAGNTAVAVKHDVPVSLMGLVRLVGARTPVTVFPKIAVSTGSTDTQHFMCREEHMTGQISSAVQTEVVLGDELTASTGETVRIATLVIDELR